MTSLLCLTLIVQPQWPHWLPVARRKQHPQQVPLPPPPQVPLPEALLVIKIGWRGT